MVTAMILSGIALAIILITTICVCIKQQAQKRNEEYQRNAGRIRKAFHDMKGDNNV